MFCKVLMVLGLSLKLCGSDVFDWKTANHATVVAALDSKDTSDDVRTSACSRLLFLMEEETNIETLLASVDLYIANNPFKKPLVITLLTQKLEGFLFAADHVTVQGKLTALKAGQDQIASASVRNDFRTALETRRRYFK